jgi:hypothetical protein
VLSLLISTGDDPGSRTMLFKDDEIGDDDTPFSECNSRTYVAIRQTICSYGYGQFNRAVQCAAVSSCVASVVENEK